MKKFFEECSFVLIICIVISLILCIIGGIKKINESTGKASGTGLLKVVSDNLTDTIDTFQTKAMPNKNLVTYNNFNFIYWDYSISKGLYANFQKEEKTISGKKTTIYNIPTKANVGNYFYSGLQAFITPTSDVENETKTYTFSFNVSADKKSSIFIYWNK